MSPESRSVERTCDFVDVALPCYNVALLLDDFMNSLLAAMDRPWRIVARDDGSVDGTGEQLAKWAARLGPQMLLLEDGESVPRNLGLIGNYNAVLAATTAPYILTADTDDVWLPGHVATVLHTLRRIESEKGGNAVIAVGTDVIVVDLNLQNMENSYWRWSRIAPRDHPSMAMVAMEFAALGSTMAVNRALLELALPIPDGAAYQDWWLAMVAVAFGSLQLLPEQTVLYRRHGENATKDPVVDFRKSALARLLKNPLIAKT